MPHETANRPIEGRLMCPDKFYDYCVSRFDRIEVRFERVEGEQRRDAERISHDLGEIKETLAAQGGHRAARNRYAAVGAWLVTTAIALGAGAGLSTCKAAVPAAANIKRSTPSAGR